MTFTNVFKMYAIILGCMEILKYGLEMLILWLSCFQVIHIELQATVIIH